MFGRGRSKRTRKVWFAAVAFLVGCNPTDAFTDGSYSLEGNLSPRRMLKEGGNNNSKVTILKGTTDSSKSGSGRNPFKGSTEEDPFSTSVVGGDPVFDPRIVGGFDVSGPGPYPWIVSLFYMGRFYCGGSLIAPRYVLTAAHCLDDSPISMVQVHVSRYNIENDVEEDTSTSRIVETEAFYLHPDFDRDTMDFDVALIELKEAIHDIEFVKLASGINSKGLASAAKEGTEVTALGWGAVSEGGGGTDVLREVTIPVWSNEHCQEAFCQEEGWCTSITPQMICAGLETGGKDSCQGDSGGPLLLAGTNIQLGIVSWGVGCARPGAPGVYSSIPVLKDWIHSIV